VKYTKGVIERRSLKELCKVTSYVRNKRYSYGKHELGSWAWLMGLAHASTSWSHRE